ncbi:ubiquitin carboxyl-terminal hydrolase 15-like [Pistacia vera]|uniref:ubiquitin carboxyl-terminal hydrolase 15-like n=1 Tax=Pistacia vera TaxID=55513 RepID=UPI0012632A0F|nr:ubiquitin carboxyl-terminal hydrolase 15-like [Pistacia vera]
MEFKNSTEGAVLRVLRNAPPSHYLLNIQSFSSLNNLNKFISDNFDAGGFEWKLCLYPNGDKENKGEGHISVYLELAEMSSLPIGWEINVIFNFFVFDQLQDKYVTIQDGRIRRFHSMSTEWGFSRFLDLETFRNPSNGYLIKDTCVFGAEVFLVKNTFKGEFLSKMEDPATHYHTWVVKNFTALTDKKCISESFGPYKWYVVLFPNGHNEGKGKNISIYLSYDRSFNAKLFVNFILRVKNQKTGPHIEKKVEDHMFCPTVEDWGFSEFMLLDTLKDPKQGYLVDDNCIIEAEVQLLGSVSLNKS